MLTKNLWRRVKYICLASFDSLNILNYFTCLARLRSSFGETIPLIIEKLAEKLEIILYQFSIP